MTHVRPTVLVLLATRALAGCSVGQPGPADQAATSISAQTFAAHVRFLAQPRLGGRVAGTAGNRAAGDYIAEQFRQIGLLPGGEGGGYFQPFTNDRLRVPADGCTLSYEPPADGASQPDERVAVARLSADFAPSAQGKLGAFSAPLVFAGYGLHNHIRGYNDYATLSARGAVVMILAGEPHTAAGQSKWALAGEQTHLAELPYKLRLAAQQGAVAALIVNPPAIDLDDDIDDVLGDCTGAIPAIRITRKFADALLADAGESRTLARLIEQIHRTGRPQSFALGGRLTGKAALVDANCRNVLAVLRPNGPDTGRTMLVGAHYDHIPATGQLARDIGPGVRYGADDNASGVAAVLLLARALASAQGRSCTYIFAAFDSEEIGFAGSRHYVQHPTCPLEQIDLMVNIDQVGHIGWRGLMLLGSTLDPSPAKAIRQAQRRTDLPIQPLPVTSTRGWSDQAAFARAGVPTLFLYCYRTAAYHSRRDTAAGINAPGGAAATRFAYDLLRELNRGLSLNAAASQPTPSP